MDKFSPSQTIKLALNETIIDKYKGFFRNNLLHVKNKNDLFDELTKICRKFQIEQKKYRYYLLSNKERSDMEFEATSLLKKYFIRDILIEFSKETPIPSKYHEDSFIAELGNLMSDLNKRNNLDFKHKTEYLLFIKDCLNSFGLHPLIELRNVDTHKRFNILIKHNHNTKRLKSDWKVNITEIELQKDFISPFSQRKHIKFNGVFIPFENIQETKITTSLLKLDEVDLFLLQNGFSWKNSKTDRFTFLNLCKDETDEYLPYPYDEPLIHKQIDILMVNETKKLLINYSICYDMYNSAITKYQEGVYERNVLDDFRLCLELLLKHIFNNSKSIENQLSEVGKYQKNRNMSSELSNMFIKLIEYYTKYQNEHVKHNDKINKNEVDLIIDLTSIFIKHLISN